jgi:hypothetical protein
VSRSVQSLDRYESVPITRNTPEAAGAMEDLREETLRRCCDDVNSVASEDGEPSGYELWLNFGAVCLVDEMPSVSICTKVRRSFCIGTVSDSCPRMDSTCDRGTQSLSAGDLGVKQGGNTVAWNPFARSEGLPSGDAKLADCVLVARISLNIESKGPARAHLSRVIPFAVAKI